MVFSYSCFNNNKLKSQIWNNSFKCCFLFPKEHQQLMRNIIINTTLNTTRARTSKDYLYRISLSIQCTLKLLLNVLSKKHNSTIKPKQHKYKVNPIIVIEMWNMRIFTGFSPLTPLSC